MVLSRALPAAATLAVVTCAFAACAREPARSTGDGAAGAVRPLSEAPLVPNQRQPLPGIVSGGQPTLDQLRRASESGFRTVINLRPPGERPGDDEPARVAELGMEYVSLPISGAADLTVATAVRFDELLAAADEPVLLHCGSGNRVGALFALRAFHVEGKSAAEALAEGRAAGLTRLEPAVRELLETTPAALATDPG